MGSSKKKQRKQYSEHDKAEALRLLAEGLSQAEAARRCDVPAQTLWNWVEQAKVDSGKGRPEQLTSDERSELTRLRRDVKRLEEERDILKKATAFFANESK